MISVFGKKSAVTEERSIGTGALTMTEDQKHCRIAELEQQIEAERAKVVELQQILMELYAVVRGECPSLLNEDSGGDVRLDEHIRAALQAPEVQGKPAQAVPLAHSVNCVKVPHTSTGYLHGEDDDTPYDVDGQLYCGRCHVALDRKHSLRGAK